MKTRILLLLAALAGLFVSCDEVPVEIPQEMYLRATVAQSGLTNIDIEVEVPDATPFYIVKYDTYTYEKLSLNPDKIVEDLRHRVEIGANWGTILKVGSQTVSFDGLMTDTDYTIVAVGLNGAGEVTTEPVVLEVTTEDISFDLNLVESHPFDFDVEVIPSRDDFGWYCFTFLGTRERFSQMDDELVATYMSYYMSNEVSLGATYEEIAFEGTGHVENDNYPDLEVMVTVAAVDRNLRIASGITRMIFTPSTEGFLAIDEKRTKNLHSLIYAYNHNELGVLLHVTGYDDDGNQGVVANAMSFNGDSMKYFGIDFFRASDSQVANAMVALYQSQFDAARKDPQYIPYFEQCTSPQQMMEMVWYTPQNLYDNGRTWDRNDIETIVEICGGEDPDEIVFVLGINKIDSKYRIYPAEYCISRCSFKELGYTFNRVNTKIMREPHRLKVVHC